MPERETKSAMLSSAITLGKSVEYKEHYSPELLQGVPRSLSRDTLGYLNQYSELPFDGVDIWNGYELSWLNTKGKPQVAILRCFVPIHSEYLIESKSFKLYLNSFNQSQFGSWDDVKRSLTSDLSHCAGDAVDIELLSLDSLRDCSIGMLGGHCIDDLDIEISDYTPKPSLLATSNVHVTESLHSHLLKSNCLITNQPDWASINIRYSGAKLCRESLLQYLVSFRQHNEFHEQCVERIFCDLMQQCKPEKLTVYARYTRRGGLDINPFRSNFEQPDEDIRLPRQ